MSEDGDATPRGAGGRVHPSPAAATPDTGAVRHGYNLRPKRKATQVADPLGDAVRTVIAPGEGEEANHRRVGGRDARAKIDVDASGSGSEALGEDPSEDQSVLYALRSEASDDWQESRSRVTTPESSTPSSPRRRTDVEDPVSRRRTDSTWSAPPGARTHPQGERARATQGHRRSAPPLQESEDPAELEAQSTRLIAQLQKFIQEREWALSSPANEPFIRGDRLASGGAKASTGGRHGPQAPHLFGNAAAKPGRSPSGTARVEGRFARGEAALGGDRAVRHFSDNGAQCGASSRVGREKQRRTVDGNFSTLDALFSDNGAQCGARSRVGVETTGGSERQHSRWDPSDLQRTAVEDRERRRASPEVRVVRESHAPRHNQKVDENKDTHAYERQERYYRPAPVRDRSPRLAVEVKGGVADRRSGACGREGAEHRERGLGRTEKSGAARPTMKDESPRRHGILRHDPEPVERYQYERRYRTPSRSPDSRSSSRSRGDRCGPRRGVSPTPREPRGSREWSNSAVCGGKECETPESEAERERRRASSRDGRREKKEKDRESKRREASSHSRDGRHRRRDDTTVREKRRSSSRRSNQRRPKDERSREDSATYSSSEERVKSEKTSSKRETSASKSHTRPHKQWFQVDRFDGTSAWRPFAERFQFCAKANGWDMTEQAAQLQACLKGMAAQILCYGKAKDWTFAELFAKLEDRFGSDDRSDEYLAKLETRKRGNKETLQQLCHSVEELVALAYPGPRTTHSDRFAVTSFLRALDDAELAGKVRDKRPQTLDEAFKMAQMFESFRTATTGGRSHEDDRRAPREPQLRTATAADGEASGGKNSNNGPTATEQRLLREMQSMREEMSKMKMRAPVEHGAVPALPPMTSAPIPSVWSATAPAFPPVLSMPPPSLPPGYGYSTGPSVPNLYAGPSTNLKFLPPAGDQAEDARYSQQKEGRGTGPSADKRCFGCNQTGHFRRDCPNPRSGAKGGPYGNAKPLRKKRN